MKRKWIVVGLLTMVALPAAAQKKEEERVGNAGKVMKEILAAPIGFGGSYGRGVMSCRGGRDFRGKWGAPTMMALEGGSVGLQLGGEATDFVLLLMNSQSASSILSSKVKLGGDASAAAGPVGRTTSAETDVAMRAEILTHSRARGAFAGVSLAGSTLRPDNDANKHLYGKEVPAKDIVMGGAVPAPPSAETLITTLDKASPANKSKN
jgi:SH3 domain-containing YSC84-like protein 1